jgi:phosphoglycolate phosphatase-like HAD superfamily hydrolase
MSSPAAAVFDFDGVIVESVDLKNRAFGELFRADHPEKVDEIIAFQLENVGASRLTKFPRIYEEILGLPFPAGELERLDREFSRIVFDAVATCPFVPGAEALLERLDTEGVPLYIASATPEREVQRLVETRGLSNRFHAVRGAPTPKADVLRDVAAECGVGSELVLFVGDAANDLRAAQEAGATFVGRVPSGAASPFPPGTVTVADLAELDRIWNGFH